jgi:predicted anti-sigma-YlaC factor YlaD
MQPDRVGRKLGVGMRVASGMLRERATQATETVRQDAPIYVEHSKNAIAGTKKGAKRFGEAVWGPFVHAGGVLWLEITGLFFALFGLFFAQGVYRLRADWRTGPNHERLLIYAVVALIFFYFSASSFYRARRKQLRRKVRSQENHSS